jgi:hypothetical protein
MSMVTGRAGQSGQGSGEYTTGADVIRAAIHRSLVATLTIGTGPGGRGGLTPSGLAHSVGVCFLEMAIVARGKGKAVGAGAGSGMPRFVDVKLSQDQRVDFAAKQFSDGELVMALQRLCDAGYRVGCAWNSDSSSYTVSVTCRDSESGNFGLCMTSFASTVHTAVALAVYKHTVVTDGEWLGGFSDTDGFFG